MISANTILTESIETMKFLIIDPATGPLTGEQIHEC